MQLIEEKNLIEVTAKDIGSGIAQVLPIIVATVGWKGMLLAVENKKVCRLLEVSKSEVGDRVYVDKHIKPAKQITIDEFLKFKIFTKKGKIIYNDKELKTNKEEVFVNGMEDGLRIH